MEVVLQSIVQLRAILLIACAAGIGIFLFGGVMSLRDLERVSFRLERTSVMRRAATYFLRALFFLGLGLGIFVATERYRANTAASSGVVGSAAMAATPFRIVVTPLPTADLSQAQAVAQNVGGATPNADPLSMPTPSLDESSLVVVTATPLPGGVDALPTFTPEPATLADSLPTLAPPNTPTPFAIPTATPAPTVVGIAALPIVATGESTPVLQPLFEGVGAPIAVDAACGDTARLTRPTKDEVATAAYDIVGTALFAGGIYRLEIIPAGESVWRHVWEGPAAASESSLMPAPLQTSLFPNGRYFLRLLVVGSNGDEVARCTTAFEIRN